MTDMHTPPAPDQHDTTAIPRPWPQGGPYGAPVAGHPAGYPGGNPVADAWEAKYLLQRTRTRVAVAVAAISTALAVVLGVAAWQFSQANPLLSAASDLASGLQDGSLGLDGLVPPGTTPEQSTPEGSAPDATTPGDGSLPDVPLSELPLPDSVKGLAGALGITDVGQLIDLGVANGLLTPEDADRLRAAVAAGALAQGLAQPQ
jgi:hypothetical protein